MGGKRLPNKCVGCSAPLPAIRKICDDCIRESVAVVTRRKKYKHKARKAQP